MILTAKNAKDKSSKISTTFLAVQKALEEISHI
jgi:hypothetical protein